MYSRDEIESAFAEYIEEVDQLSSKVEFLEDSVEKLSKIIVDTIWMARRYADGRQTYAPEMANDALDMCKELGIKIDSDWCLSSGEEYATIGSAITK
jgi:hypothetical protein